MTDDGLDEERQEHEAEPALDWSPLGTTAPRVPHRRPRKHRDLGPGGSHRQDADRARSLRHPVRFHGIPVARTLAIASGAILVAALVLTIAISGWWVLALLAVTVPPMVAGVRLLVVRPTAEARLIVRARAEQRIAAELDPLAVSGWTLFHDRVLVGGEHRLAHIAVGPAGVFVIEPLPAGEFRIIGERTEAADGRELYIGSMHLGQWLDTRRWEVIQLEPAIAQGLEDMVWTGPTAAIAVEVPAARWQQLVRRRPKDAVPDMPYDWNGVTLRPLTALVETLTALPAPLDRPAVAQLAAVVERLCPPAGRVDDAQESNGNNAA